MSLVICCLRHLSRGPETILIHTYKLCGIVCTWVELYCAPIADGRESRWASMLHIALEGGCFVLSANQLCKIKYYPPPPDYLFGGSNVNTSPEIVVSAGGNVIISPSGTVLVGPNFEGEDLISTYLGKTT